MRSLSRFVTLLERLITGHFVVQCATVDLHTCASLTL